jgi:hypothetical protein
MPRDATVREEAAAFLGLTAADGVVGDDGVGGEGPGR